MVPWVLLRVILEHKAWDKLWPDPKAKEKKEWLLEVLGGAGAYVVLEIEWDLALHSVLSLQFPICNILFLFVFCFVICLEIALRPPICNILISSFLPDFQQIIKHSEFFLIFTYPNCPKHTKIRLSPEHTTHAHVFMPLHNATYSS